ncbi:MAG: hypothetical protein COA86_13840 [Kangiella sp.]|nr:MAG: hypothetical protein COA86_13840 [Kangiella sp.]
MLKLDDFFGLKLEEERSDISSLLNLIGVDYQINQTNVVRKIAASNGIDSPIVGVARRQQFLKMIKPLLVSDMLKYDANYYTKEVNTSSQHDRRYCSEEKLILVASVIASTKSLRVLKADPNIMSEKNIRENAFVGTRFDKMWDLLTKETQHIVDAFRKSKK